MNKKTTFLCKFFEMITIILTNAHYLKRIIYTYIYMCILILIKQLKKYMRI